jgi:NAD(P)-dependent dehydrogenase (short-subunit alcohol dehydrogenase family)
MRIIDPIPVSRLLPLLEKDKTNESEFQNTSQDYRRVLFLNRSSFAEHASVINIASVAAYTPMAESGLSEPGHGTWSCACIGEIYSAPIPLTDFLPPFPPHADQPSKAASVHLTRTMANSLADKFVLVNAICPGVFPSKMTAFGLSENKDILEGIQPTGRVGSPQDIGGVALLLASRAGAHMTGNAVSLAHERREQGGER